LGKNFFWIVDYLEMIKVLDTAAGDIVEISFPAIGPYGIVLAADTDG
jgi:hypothetical protein